MRTRVHHRGFKVASPLRTLAILALVLALLGAMLVSTIRPAMAATSYTIQDLGTLSGGSYSVAESINEAGQVVGTSEKQVSADEFGPLTEERAFLWQNGQMQDLGTLFGGSESSASDINGSGQIVGGQLVGDFEYHSFLWQDGQMQDLSGSDSVANGINDSGQIALDVGSSAFLWQNGQTQPLGHLSASENAQTFTTSINGFGHIVGNSSRQIGTEFGEPVYAQHAFLWKDSQMQDLGTLPGGSYSFAESINDSGQVVGYADVRTGTDINGDPITAQSAFMWKNGQMQELGLDWVAANDINDLGDAVGYSMGGPFKDAMLLQNGFEIRLDDALATAGSDWDLREARAINNKGQIVGYGQKQVGTNQFGNPITESHAFLLTPAADTTAPDTTIDRGPSGTVSSTTASFSFSSSEANSTFECSLDGAPFTTCSSPKSYTGLSNGSHTFKVKSTDAAGNTDATPASRTWTVSTMPPPPAVDTTKPSISGMSPRHRSITRDTTPTIRATVRDNLTNLSKRDLKLYVAGKRITKFRYSAATDRLSYTSPRLTKGKKVVKIVASDAAGNVGARSWYFTIR